MPCFSRLCFLSFVNKGQGQCASGLRAKLQKAQLTMPKLAQPDLCSDTYLLPSSLRTGNSDVL